MFKNKSVTMKDVAHDAGVSVMTVSRALQKDTSIREETRLKIDLSVKKLGYVMNKMAGGLSSKRSDFVALLVPSLNNSHLATSVRVITDKCREQGLQVLLGLTDYSMEREEELVRAMLSRRPEAFILTVDGHSEATIKLLKASQIPVIEMWELPANPIHHVVGFSNYAAMGELIAVMKQKGAKNIAYIGESHYVNTRGGERRRAYLDHVSPHIIVDNSTPPITFEDGARAFREIMTRYPETDCVMCVSDPPAFGALMEAQRMGINVPERVRITGFGDFEISRASTPSITTVAVNPQDIGRETGIILTEAIKAARLGLTYPAQRIDLTPEILLRNTA
jgi:LacI family transcriptional regulator, gluconate utilization system Gnt-I transcriptional repressor